MLVGLRRAGTLLCVRAIRDEGTSHHYTRHTKYSYPDKTLTKKFEKCSIKNKVEFKKSTSWTIGAPYRKTIEEIKSL